MQMIRSDSHYCFSGRYAIPLHALKEAGLSWAGVNTFHEWIYRCIRASEKEENIPEAFVSSRFVDACMSTYHMAREQEDDYATIDPGRLMIQTLTMWNGLRYWDKTPTEDYRLHRETPRSATQLQRRFRYNPPEHMVILPDENKWSGWETIPMQIGAD